MLRRTALVLSFVALASVLVACAGGSATVSLKRERTGSIEWSPCGSVQCGSLSVPLDATRPNGPHITLALARLPAAGTSRGVLFTNPGGPGASGVDFLRDAAAVFPTEIRHAFDLVSWDPRGTGNSAPIHCIDKLDPFYAIDRSPDDAAEITANVNSAQQFAASCERGSGAELPYVSTRATARDMDAIRSAMGETQLSYLGFSYGTYLGALYAEMFPTRVRAMVLDGAVDPSLDYTASVVQQSAGFEHELDAFFSYCRSHHCGFATGADPRVAFSSLADDVDAEPQYAKLHGKRRVLGPDEFNIGVANALYSGADGFKALGAALAQTATGVGNQILESSDEYTGRQPDGTYNSETAALYAIACIDAPSPRTLTEVEQVASQAAVLSPNFGAVTTWLGLPCTYWPVPSREKIGPIHAPGTPPIVVVGTTGDPATPYASAQSLARQLGSGHLLTWEGDGHTAYARGSDCIDHAVDQYLLHLTVPPADTRCS